MLRRTLRIVVLVLAVLAGGVSPAPATVEGAPGEAPAGAGGAGVPGYLIGPGDALTVTVWDVEALSRGVTVLPDGTISLPLVGRVTATGKTVDQLEQELREKFSRFVADPVVAVEVKQVTSLIIYVIGRVNQPGRFLLTADVNILQALATAGGLNPFAKRDGIKVFRQEGEGTTILEFDYDEVSRGKRLEQNVVLRRGDVIVVP